MARLTFSSAARLREWLTSLAACPSGDFTHGGRPVDISRTVAANRMDGVHGFGPAAARRDPHRAKERLGASLTARVQQHGFLQVYFSTTDAPDPALRALLEEAESCLFCERTAAFAHSCCCKACAGSRGEEHHSSCCGQLWKPPPTPFPMPPDPVVGTRVRCAADSQWETFYCWGDQGEKRFWYWDRLRDLSLLPWAPPADWVQRRDGTGLPFWQRGGAWFYEL